MKNKLKYLYLILILLLINCSGLTNKKNNTIDDSIITKTKLINIATLGTYTQQYLNPPTSVIPSFTPTSTLQTTITPSRIYQLTYTMPKISNELGGSGYDSLFGIEVDCIKNELLCMDESKLLLQTADQRLGDSSKPRGRISGYSWSPDGKKIALCTPGIGNQNDIFVSDINKQNWKNITNSSIEECSPSWSPDGKYIAYHACSSDIYGGCQIFMSPEIGGDQIKLLNKITKFFSENPVWTYDGKKMLFQVTDDQGYWQIYMANLDGSDLQQLTQGNMDSKSPSISVDGKVVVFERKIDQDHFDIYKLDLAKNEEIRITENIASQLTNPMIAPFGSWIAFGSDKGVSGGTNIFLVGDDGHEIIMATQGGGEYKMLAGWRNLSNP